MSRAGSDLMDMLHGLVATGLTEELQRAIEAAAQPRTVEVEEDGQTVERPNPAYAPINPQLIDKALKFLKDNGIDAPKANKKVDTLAETLGQLDLDEEGARLAH